MKFGKKLKGDVALYGFDEQIVFRYKYLKKLIKATRRTCGESNSKVPLCSPTFAEAVAVETNKVEYVYKEAKRSLKSRLKSLSNASSLTERSEMLDEIESDLENLIIYASLNREALRKIIKKYRKQLKDNHQEAMYELSNYNFATGKGLQSIRLRIREEGDRLSLLEENSRSSMEILKTSKTFLGTRRDVLKIVLGVCFFLALVTFSIIRWEFRFAKDKSNSSELERTSVWVVWKIWNLVVDLGLLAYLFACMAVVCDEYMMPATEMLCDLMHISDDVAGVTLLAFSSSAPEIVMSVVGVIHNDFKASMACVMGSGIIGFGLIPAVCILGISSPLRMTEFPVYRDLTIYSLILLLTLFFCNKGAISMSESLILVSCYVLYLLIVIFSPPSNASDIDEYESIPTNRTEVSLRESVMNDIESVATLKTTTLAPEIVEKRSQVEEPTKGEEKCVSNGVCDDYRDFESAIKGDSDATQDENENEQDEEDNPILELLLSPFKYMLSLLLPDPDPKRITTAYMKFYIFGMSLAVVSLLSELIMAMTSNLSQTCHVPQEISGILILAIGAQVPDTLESYSMAKLGRGNGALSNAFSSQILNLIGGIAVPYLAYTIMTGKELTVGLNHTW
eukprot:CAMPEP_0184489534 /NCGR_PEP_ID=MMETSP0113_2-20130426/15742_1 /TAXON_ID=91329 /ORGANISM="Norrisiella sphaerica, Strain BC52" /LENGTH=621 /DNA_ID=CAMNT_0026873021 /DNA_START=117 /DNA_END=1979 /DNA_ORIENTATION=+